MNTHERWRWKGRREASFTWKRLYQECANQNELARWVAPSGLTAVSSSQSRHSTEYHRGLCLQIFSITSLLACAILLKQVYQRKWDFILIISTIHISDCLMTRGKSLSWDFHSSDLCSHWNQWGEPTLIYSVTFVIHSTKFLLIFLHHLNLVLCNLYRIWQWNFIQFLPDALVKSNLQGISFLYSWGLKVLFRGPAVITCWTWDSNSQVHHTHKKKKKWVAEYTCLTNCIQISHPSRNDSKRHFHSSSAYLKFNKLEHFTT